MVVVEKKERTLLIAAYKNPRQKADCEEHLNELALLAETFGVEPVGREACFIRKFDAATFLTLGKLEEMIVLADKLEATLVIIDEEIAPSQQRNLEKLFKRPVIDRTELILNVFAQRAQTKEAKLQIELAKTRYESPRLKRLWTHLSRQQGSAGGGAGGGGGYLKGEGEKQIEIDRRILKRKIDLLQDELEEVKLHRQQQRSARERSHIPTFAIVGYTNAGKSTLMNALTQAGVFVEDKLFATLDTTTRKFTLPNNQEVLLIDTVGFIRKLPHLLVAAFKSTLEEALFADILLNIVDVSHPAAFEQAEVTQQILKELNAEKRPLINVLNKVDLLQDPSVITQFKLKYPHTVEISALTGKGLPELAEQMIEELKKQRALVTLRIPQENYSAVSEAMRLGTILKTSYDENDVILNVELPTAVMNKWQKYRVDV